MSQPAPHETETTVPMPRRIGGQMAALRTQFNLTTQEVSERLHIRSRYVTAIEEGRYDLMPGKVYARGYVHTYAEFLGMNANEVVAQCFAGEAAANAQPVPTLPRSVSYTASKGARFSIFSRQWRAVAMLVTVALALVLIVSQFLGHGRESEPPSSTVAPVPEAMLASMRDRVMPTANNYFCLTGDGFLACYRADPVMRELSRLEQPVFYGGALDAYSIPLTPAAEDASTQKPADDD